MSIYVTILVLYFASANALDGINAEGVGENLKEMKMMITEFEPCEGFENSDVVFYNTDIWMKTRKMVDINCTIELKRDIDDTFKITLSIEKCPVGSRASCETFPDLEADDVCDKLFEPGSIYEAIIENAENLNVRKCPIPKGTYRSTGGQLEIVKNMQESLKLKSFEGDYYIHVKYYLSDEIVGCQYVEGVLVEQSGAKKGK